VAPIRIDAAHFSPDTRIFIRLLHTYGVQYLIVGGEAVILHGHTRLTGDVDFFYARDPANLKRLYAALEDFWDENVPGLQTPEELGPEGTIVQFGVPPNRIDLINTIEGVDFTTAWSGRVQAVLVAGENDIPVSYIGLDELITNKRATGRPRDLDDLSFLTKKR
jgi:hypothetical protein